MCLARSGDSKEVRMAASEWDRMLADTHCLRGNPILVIMNTVAHVSMINIYIWGIAY